MASRQIAINRRTPASAPDRLLDALVIGAGFSGLYQLHSLRDRLGLDVEIIEAGDGVGGTWYWNRYPGARCDSESHGYCYSFSPELIDDWVWSERYPGQAEILRYLDHVADRFDLKRSIVFDTRVIAAQFDDTAKQWIITTDRGVTRTARFLIAAVGCLSSTNMPKIEGLETFAGRVLHTGRWPHDEVDFTGQRVGLIGTGSTGIQATPVIAESALHLTVFQRTPTYSVPARNAPLTPEFRAWAQANLSDLRALMHANTNGHPFAIADRRVFDVTADEREALYEAAWTKGGLQFRATFQDLLADQAANDTAADFLKRKIHETVHDQATARLLADIDHPYAGKRPPIDTGYFEAFNRANVALVDVRSDPIAAITPTGIRTGKAGYPLDLIVFATGFDAMTGPLLQIDIRGRDGLRIQDAWAAGPRTYLGLQVAGFPNLFTLTGPGSPSVLCNMPVAIEQHVEWVTACIAHMGQHGRATIEATDASADAWVAQVEAAAAKTLLSTVKHSWYLGANVPGKPRMFMPYAGGLAHYRAICNDVADRDYAGFLFDR